MCKCDTGVFDQPASRAEKKFLPNSVFTYIILQRDTYLAVDLIFWELHLSKLSKLELSRNAPFEAISWNLKNTSLVSGPLVKAWVWVLRKMCITETKTDRQLRMEQLFSLMAILSLHLYFIYTSRKTHKMPYQALTHWRIFMTLCKCFLVKLNFLFLVSFRRSVKMRNTFQKTTCINVLWRLCNVF